MLLNIDLVITFTGPREALREEDVELVAISVTPDPEVPARWTAALESCAPRNGAIAERRRGGTAIADLFETLVRASAVLRGRPGIVVHDVLHDIGYQAPRAPRQVHDALPHALLLAAVTNGDRIGISIYPDDPEDDFQPNSSD